MLPTDCQSDLPPPPPTSSDRNYPAEYTNRSALDVSKLWISRRMLAIESALLKAYGGVGPTVKAQDAIRQGRRVRMRYENKDERVGPSGP